MPNLSLATAQQIIAAALAGKRSSPERRIAVAVCDAGAHPLALAREDGAAPLLAHIAQAKAFTCVAYGKPTDLVRDWAEATPAWFEGVTNVAQSRMGLPLIGSKGAATMSNVPLLSNSRRTCLRPGQVSLPEDFLRRASPAYS